MDGRLLDSVREKAARGAGRVDMPDVNCRKGVPEAAALKQLKGARSRRGGANGHEVVLGHEGVHEHEVGH